MDAKILCNRNRPGENWSLRPEQVGQVYAYLLTRKVVIPGQEAFPQSRYHLAVFSPAEVAEHEKLEKEMKITWWKTAGYHEARLQEDPTLRTAEEKELAQKLMAEKLKGNALYDKPEPGTVQALQKQIKTLQRKVRKGGSL